MTIRIVSGLSEIDADEWNALVGPDDPFMEHEFLHALEVSGSVGDGSGWDPKFFILESDNHIAAAIPAYIKTNSYGEFIFDFEWADAYQRAGLPYYPKLVAAVPFTPVTGQRILLRPDVKSNAEQFEDELIQKMISFSKEQELSSIHFLFPTRKEQEKFQNFHFIPRLSTQYHWLSHGEQNFDDYLARLRSKKRKQIQKERAAVREAGVNISILHGDEINEEHIRVIWEFYLINASRKWGRAYLKKEFFDKILENFRHRTVLVLAELNGEWIAGTIGFTKGDVLYGRYWGSRVQVPFLHFECCYYAHIDYAIQNKLKRFEAGAQGEHKFLRGFETCPTYSAHWIARDDARVAIDSLVKRETIYVQEMMAQYNRISPDKVLRSQS